MQQKPGFFLVCLALCSLSTFTMEQETILPLEVIREIAEKTSNIADASALQRTCTNLYNNLCIDTILLSNPKACANLSEVQHTNALIRYAQADNRLLFENVIRHETPINYANRSKVYDYFGYRNKTVALPAYLGKKNNQDTIEETAVYGAVMSSNFINLLIVLKNNADTGISLHGDKVTPLMLACMKNNYPMADALIKHGCDINAHNRHGWTALHFARKYTKILELLLKQPECEINPQDFLHLDTPLHFAIQDNLFNSIKLLLDYGASIIIKNGMKETPSQLLPNYCIPYVFSLKNRPKRKEAPTTKQPDAKKRKI